MFASVAFSLIATIWFLPGWLYRITLKSTAWFWWPLAYLGEARSKTWHPALYHRQAQHSLKGRATIALAIITIVGFVLTNLVLSGAIVERNPLLSPIGLLFLIKRTVAPWQILSVLLAGLSLWVILRLDGANIDHQYGRNNNLPDVIAAAERKFYWTERLGRLQLVLVILFQLIVAGQAVLYLNSRSSRSCWFRVPANVAAHAQWLYGNLMPGTALR